MLLKSKLQNFRNFKDKEFIFSPGITVIVGQNAFGKTNILESVYLLATGKSFKAQVEEEMINYDAHLARVMGKAVEAEVPINLEAVLTRGEVEVGDSKIEKLPRKRLLVNGVARRLIDYAGNFKVVIFAPWDMDLVTGSPSGRRRFLDGVLSQVDYEYRRASLSYEKGLRQRNRLLFRIREEGISRSQLMFWDKLLIKNGDYVSKVRGEFIDFVNGKKNLSFKGSDFSLEYDKSAISEGRLAQYAEEEIAAATTLVGPHRDDFQFSIVNSQLSNKDKRDLARYGSRGEQRMGIVWLKNAELSYVESKSGKKPTFLLDDVFSELDHEHREIVLKLVGSEEAGGFGGQSIITTADPHFVENIKGTHRIDLLT